MTTDAAVAKVSIVGAGIGNAPGYAARMFGALADAGINIEMISTSEIRITCIIAEDQVDEAARALHRAFRLQEPETAGSPRHASVRPPDRRRGARCATGRPRSRLERFERVDSTQRVVREWLAAGVPEVCARGRR